MRESGLRSTSLSYQSKEMSSEVETQNLFFIVDGSEGEIAFQNYR